MKFKKILTVGISKQAIDPKFWGKIDSLGEKRVSLSEDSPEVDKHLTETDCLLVRFNVVDKAMIDMAKNLKYIGALATGVGKIDSGYAKKRGIVVTNVPGYSTESVAEFVIAAILEAIRQLEEGKKRGRVGNYSEAGISATEIKNKIFGVIGLGNIGRRVAEIAQGFGADVRYWSRHRKKDAEKKGIKYEELDSLVKKADLLSVNVAQTKETEGILDKKRLANVQTGAVVVNTAPMELVDIDGLVARLKKDDIIFILDHSDEMTEADLKKISPYGNCIIYPPMAYISKEAAIAKQEIFVSNMENFLNGKPKNVVN